METWEEARINRLEDRIDRLERKDWERRDFVLRWIVNGLTARYEGIFSVGFALIAFGVADVTNGNGLIAAFVCGIAMAAAERD
jgi:hypothetical protein